MTDHPGQPDRSLGLQDNTELLHRISGRLADRFAGIFAAETVERYVFESYTALARTAKVSAYLPATTEHFASDRFNALAESKGAVASEVPEVLFVSRSERRTVPNGRRPAHHRSQGQDPCPVRWLPAGGRNRPRRCDGHGRDGGAGPLPELPEAAHRRVVRASDVVITMGCGDSCPIYPGKHYEDWDLTDPAGQPHETVREIRDQIHDRVKTLVASLLTKETTLP
jgi:arsenate reductase